MKFLTQLQSKTIISGLAQFYRKREIMYLCKRNYCEISLREHLLYILSSLSRNQDGGLSLTTPRHRILYNSLSVEVAVNQVLSDSQLCGLCGSLSGDLLTSQQCLPRRPHIAALSYRLQQGCSALSRRQEVEKEEAKTTCLPKTSSSQEDFIFSDQPRYPDRLADCARSRHAVVRLGGQVCVSQLPVQECGRQQEGCTVRNRATKMVGFVCLPPQRERVTRLYADKAARGEMLPELREAFVAVVILHLHC